VQAHGPGAERNFPGETISEPPVRKGERKQQSYRGVSWDKASSSYHVQMADPQTKRQRKIGSYASEEDAARAYDFAAVQAHGPSAIRNFPGEDISEMPVSKGEERKQRSSSRYLGVSWHKAKSSFQVKLRDSQIKRQRHVGYFTSEEDAARAYDFAAVQAHGPGVKRNFSGEAISEPPVALGEERKQQKSSRYVGVTWDKRKSSWKVQLYDPQSKRNRNIGSYASEEEAARAYDCATMQACRPGAKRNFPGEAISKLPATVGEERKQQKSSRYIGAGAGKALLVCYATHTHTHTRTHMPPPIGKKMIYISRKHYL
jgi:hypothetical protein